MAIEGKSPRILNRFLPINPYEIKVKRFSTKKGYINFPT